MRINKYSTTTMCSRMMLVLIAGYLNACSSTGGKSQPAPIESREPSSQSERTSTEPAPVPEVSETYEMPESEATTKVTPLDGPDFSKIESLDDPGSAAVKRKRVAPDNDATLSLMADAKTALERNDVRGAESITNRAIRIAPREPKLWLVLAEVRMRQGQYADAIALAERAIDLGNGDAAIEAAGLQVITKSRGALGDTGAAAASMPEAE